MNERAHLHVVTSEPLPPKPGPGPRPERMFGDAGQEYVARKRAQRLFIEAMTASGALTMQELRVGIALVLHYRPTFRYAHPSMQYLADALGMDKRNAGKALKSLEAKGWFIVDHGARGRGKNYVNRYRPSDDKVPSAAPFKTAAMQAAEQRAESEKVSLAPRKGVSAANKGVSTHILYVPSVNVAIADTSFLRKAPRDARVAVTVDSSAPDFVILNKLRQIDEWLKAGSNRKLTAAEARTVEKWRAFCEEVSESHDGHKGDPIGGLALRLEQELAALEGS